MKIFPLLSMTFTTLSGIVVPNKSVANPSEHNATTKKKNVLMIAVDDLKPLLGCYGDSIAYTPNIDKLASQGILFSSAYCQQAVSAASRTSLLTGWCPDRTRVWDLNTQIRSQNPNVVTLPQYFKENGYEVAGVGKIFDPRSVDKQMDKRSWTSDYMVYEECLNKEYDTPVMSHYQAQKTRGLYNRYCKEAQRQGIKKQSKINKYIQKYIKPATECTEVPDNAYADGAIADKAVKFLNEYDSCQPFFLAVGFKKPHLPFCAPQKYWEMYHRENLPLAAFSKRAINSPAFAYHHCNELQSYSDIPPLISFSENCNIQMPDEKARELIHGYYACISYIDAQIGKILDALEKSGQKENTLIVLWGDHGWHLGDHGLWNKHTNFEHATHVPLLIIDHSHKARQIEAPVEFLSVYPTLCDLAGLSVPAGLDGENLSRIIKDERNAGIIQPYAVSQYPRAGKMGYSLRSSRYRYTVWVDWYHRKLNADKIFSEELYDYEKDPHETKNVVSDADYADALRQMRLYWNEFKAKRLSRD